MATLATYASGHIKFVERYRLENLWEDRDGGKQEGKEKAMERERERAKKGQFIEVTYNFKCYKRLKLELLLVE